MAFQRELGGEPVPGYRLIERLGGGGFGEVWKVEAPGGMHKALKFVYGDLQTTSEEGHRAGQELKALNRVKTVRHPYILSLERYDIIDGQLIIIMELADKNLWDRFRECKAQGLNGIPREELMRYMEEAAEALDLMNLEYQLQHLDIKPQNLFLVYNHLKVADFGLVKDLEGMVASVTGGVTPVYAAPETFDGMVTRFCDQYSLAIVYQELLTGQRPFVGTNIHQLVMQHVQGKPNLSSLPAGDREIIAKALSKNPDERFPSCGDMVRALRAAGQPRSNPELQMAPVGAPPETEARVRSSRETLHDLEIPATLPPMRISGGETAAEPARLRPLAFLEEQKEPARAADTPLERQAPPEVTGDGELFPAYMIGLGELGIGVLQKLRESLQERFGATQALSHLRFLGIDIDPEIQQAAPAAGQGVPLPANELLLTKLNRALHYQKVREGRPRIDTWFNPNMLYRIQRNLTTGGLRALGRLAFIDNYRTIVQRLRLDLEACLDPDNLKLAVKQTGLKLRTNRPRVYIVAGLGGGTGSGMFIDAAYLMRNLLRQLGYVQPDVVGLLLLPGAGKNGQQKALVNAYAALTELNHFSTPGIAFAARFDDREGSVIDPGPPFSRCLLLPLPAGNDPDGLWKVLGLTGEFLARDLATPLGRAVDAARAALSSAGSVPANRLVYQTFGMTRFWWNKQSLLQRASRKLCQHLVKHWIAKDNPPAWEVVQKWVQEQWTAKELSGDLQIGRLQSSAERTLGKPPEVIFASFTESFVPRGWRGLIQLDAAVVRDVFNKIEKMLGQPSGSTSVLYKPGVLEESLRQEAETMMADWERNVLNMTASLFERPEFRLSGAEEAIRQLIALIDQMLKHYEPLSKDINQNSAKENERLLFLMGHLDEIASGGRSTSQYANELVALLKTYPKTRYQSLILKIVQNTYTKVRAQLSEHLREVGFFRARLNDLLHVLEESDQATEAEEEAGDEFHLLPTGCRTPDDAVAALVAQMIPAKLGELDQRMQNMIRQQFRGLSNVCASPPAILKSLEEAMLEEAAAFAGSCMSSNDIVEMFLNRYPHEEEAKRILSHAFDAAAPELLGRETSSRYEFAVLAAPHTPQEARFRDLAAQAVPEAELHPAVSADDILFYREDSQFSLNKLAQLGAECQEAYQQSGNQENLTPHTRIDIEEWQRIA